MGPLAGVTVVELAGIGPAPFCGMMLSDMGARVIRIDRMADGRDIEPARSDVLNRGRRSIAVDLKRPEGVGIALRLIERADALIEGFRPGVMERLGLGPDVCLERNQRLVYGRMTGWGQHGPLAQAAGHDINYIALTGALHAIGAAEEPPTVPLNLIGDFGGGGMLLAFGVVCALLEARASGKGQVVDAAMTDGTAALMAMTYGLKAGGRWNNGRASNLLDGGAFFYACYQCADGKAVAVGALEPQFYAELLKRAGISDPDLARRDDPAHWRQQRDRLAAIFRTKTRDEWCALLEGTDACVAPVLDLDEAPDHPHNRARQTFVAPGGTVQPAPAPRFSRTAASIQSPPAGAGEHGEEILHESGYGGEEIRRLRNAGVVG